MQEPPLTFHAQGLIAAASFAIGAVAFVLWSCTLYERLSYSLNRCLHQLTQELIGFCQ